MKGAVWGLPDIETDTHEIQELAKVAEIDTTGYGNDLKIITYHPTDGTKAVSVVDNNFVLWDLGADAPKVIVLFLSH